MKAMGRVKIRMPVGKWKIKSNGKHIPAWWEDIAMRSKTSVRMAAKRDIRNQL